MRGMKEAAHTHHAGSSTYARNAQWSTGGRSAGPMREIAGGNLPSQAAKDPMTHKMDTEVDKNELLLFIGGGGGSTAPGGGGGGGGGVNKEVVNKRYNPLPHKSEPLLGKGHRENRLYLYTADLLEPERRKPTCYSEVSAQLRQISTLRQWQHRLACTKRELLSLIGQLQNACCVDKAGRPFLNT